MFLPDISRWQGIVNFDALKNAHVPTGEPVEGVLIKAGGSDDGFYPDGQFTRNAAEARRVGLVHGFYVYLGGVESVENEVQHIKNLVSMIGGLQPGESLWLDWEEHHADERAYVTGIAQGLIAAGLPRPGVYMSLSRVTGQDWTGLVQLNSGLWVAAWGNNDAIPDAVPGSDEWPFWAVWQYSSTGSIQGIGGRVDLDKFNGDRLAFAAYGAQGVVPPPAPQPVTQPSPPTATDAEYVVASGDNMSSIAAKYGHSWQELWALNRDRVSNPNKIFAGQHLRVWGSASAPQTREYTVASGDTLTGIGAKLGIDWHVLYNNNVAVIGPNPNLIKAGQKLRY
jgi:GH25 family lysozyme M1 (1,4-beta-N-acetylmuramidase)/LysM repeat protein